MASRLRHRPAVVVAPRAVQTELFPRPLVFERLDPRRVGGARTRVSAVYLVREHADAPAHRVFHDRHGWYCEEHGGSCPMVAELRRALGASATA
jgi:hypothetical protein